MHDKKEKPSRSNITVKNIYFETANPGNPVFQQLVKKQVFRNAVSRYWLSRALAKVAEHSKEYLETRATTARDFAQKYSKDGEQKDKDGEVIRSWKKGDPVSFPDGSVSIQDTEGFRKQVSELQEVEVDLGIPQVPFNEVLNLPHEEEMIILPLMEEIDEDKLVKLYEEQQKREEEEREAQKDKK